MERKDLPAIGIEILEFVEKHKHLENFKKIAHDFINAKALDDLSELKKLEDVIFYELGDEELENKIYSSNIKGMILTKAGVIKSEPVMEEQDVQSLDSLKRRSSFNKMDITYSTRACEFE